MPWLKRMIVRPPAHLLIELDKDLLLYWVLLVGAIGVAETIADVAEPVEDPVVVLAVAVSVPLPDETEAEVVVEASSPTVDEAAGVELVDAASIVVVESSCRGSGRRTPAKTALRHRSRANRAQNRWDTAITLILDRRVRDWNAPPTTASYNG